jgi:hypothetical protein
MQDLTAILGGPGAAKYLELLGNAYRVPAWELLALDANGDTVFDLTPYLVSASPQFTDEMKSHSCTYTIANPGATFDRYGSSPNAGVLVENRILRFRKGLKDPETGTSYLLPAFWGLIIEATPSYAPSGETIIQVTVADALKNAIRGKYTSPAYENTEVNFIATDLLRRFGKFAPERIQLLSVSKIYPFAQFPDFGLMDALKILYDPLLFWVRADEAGIIRTGPRLGTVLSGFSDILGYPDLTEPPDEEAVAYVIPDVPGVETIEPRWQDFDGVSNQYKVLGKATAARQTLGPTQILYIQPNAAFGAKDRNLRQYPFSQPTGSTNSIVARNAIIEWQFSTNHQLDTAPRTVLLSLLNWRGAWVNTTTYAAGDAVSHMGLNYACNVAADSTIPPTNADYWSEIPFEGPFVRQANLTNEDPRTIGFIRLESVTASYVIFRIEGRQYSVGNPYPRKYGGADYRFNIWGQPVLSHSRTLTAYADYNVNAVIGEELSDPFSDHMTFQAEHAPLAMSVPVEVFIDGDSQGKIAADGTVLTGEQKFGVDFERGRIVLKNATYRDWEKDRDASGQHPYSSGGTENDTAQDFGTTQLEVQVPEAVLQSYRQGNSVYTFSGLTVGQGYDIRFTFADPDNLFENQRVFSVYAQGAKIIEGLDIVKQTGGAYIAHQETVTGIGPDISGEIVIYVTQNDPVTGALLSECSQDGSGGGGAIGTAIVFGIELLLPQGEGASTLAVNCGGDELTPTPPTVTANYGFSPLQEEYGIQSQTIDDPLLSTQEECENVGQFWVNFSTWRRHQQTLRTASIGHLQPGDLIRWYSPAINSDMWGYLQSITRNVTTGGADTDTYLVYLLYVQARA